MQLPERIDVPVLKTCAGSPFEETCNQVFKESKLPRLFGLHALLQTVSRAGRLVIRRVYDLMMFQPTFAE